jgi:hypothetical protein
VDSNHRHRAYETPALPTELRRQRTDTLEAVPAEIATDSRPHDRKAPGRCQGHIHAMADSRKKFLVAFTTLSGSYPPMARMNASVGRVGHQWPGRRGRSESPSWPFDLSWGGLSHEARDEDRPALHPLQCGDERNPSTLTSLPTGPVVLPATPCTRAAWRRVPWPRPSRGYTADWRRWRHSPSAWRAATTS